MAAELKVGIGADITELQKGVNDAVKKVDDLVSGIGNIKVPEIKIPPISVPKIPPIDTATFDKLNIELNKIGANTELFGKSLEGSKRQLSAYKSALEDLIGQGIRPTHPEVLKLADEISKLDKEISEATKKVPKLKSALESLKEVGEKLQSIGTKLSVGLTAPIVGLSTVALKAFSDLEGVRIAFNRLNDPKLLDNLRKATKGTTSDLELMQATVRAEKFGLSTNALPTLLEYAGRVAKDTGQEVNYLVDSIVTGIGRKSPLILDNLGISASQLKAELGGATFEAASVATVTEAVGRIAAKELAKMGKDTKTLSESWLQVKTAINNSMGKIGEIISKNLDISGIIDKLTGYINKAVSAFESLSPGIQKSILVVAGLVAAAGPLLAIIGSILAVLPSVVAGFGLFSAALTAMTGPIGLVVLGIGAIIAAVVGNWSKIKPYIEKTINNLIELYNESKAVRVIVQSIGFAFQTAFQSVGKILVGVWNSFKNFGKGILELFAGIGTAIKGALSGNLDEVGSGIKRGFNAINNTAIGFVNVFKGTLSEIGNVFNENEKKWSSMGKKSPIKLGDISVGGAGKIADSTEKTVTEGIKKGVKKAGEKPVVIELEAIDTSKLKESFDKSYKEVITYQQMLSQAFYNNSEAINNSIASIPTALSEAQISIQSGILGVMEGLKPLADFGNFLGNSIDLAFDTVVNTITDSFSAIGEAMATGGNIFSAAGNAILSGIGSFLGELGKQMVQYGVAALAMSVLSKMLLNPITAAPAAVAMIAAGAALSLISGAIKGTLSKGSSGSGGGSIPSGGGGSSNYSSSFSSGGGSGEVVFRISGNDLVGVLSRQQDKNTRIGG